MGDLQVLKCSCSEYSTYKGIVYLINDPIRKKSVDFIRGNHKILAIKTLLNLPYRLFIPFYFITETGLAKILGFENTIRLLKLFGYDSNWSRYLIKRKEIPYYQISSASLATVNRKQNNVLDVGCGTGHFFPEIVDNLNPKNIVGIDISFLSLCLSKYFFDDKRTSYVCYDIENILPFNDNEFGFIHMADTLQYIKDKKHLLKDLGRICKKTGTLVIPHTHEKSMPKIIGINKKLAYKFLTNSGFVDINIYTDNNLLANLDLSNLASLSNSDAYNMFASKSSLAKNRLFKKKKFIFVSPHLDDAVLSAFFLIKKLKVADLEVDIVTVFTKGCSEPYPPQAENFLKLSGFDNPKDLFSIFKKEDTTVMKNLGISFSHLDFVDAAFRKDKFGKTIYKDAKKQFSGHIQKEDMVLIRTVADKVGTYIENSNDTVFICPVGIGGHVDHILIREAVKLLNKTTIFWEDYPYNTNPSSVRSFFAQNKKYHLLFKLDKESTSAKQKVIRIYKSQMKALFPYNQITNLNEKYYKTNK